MSPDVSAVPPEAEVIRLAREAAGMTAQSAAEASRTQDGKGVSAAYWRDVERGTGGRRGERVPTRASARALAAMARVVSVTPAQLTGAGREDAARVLDEILRREDTARAIPPDSGGTYAEVDEVASILYAPLIQRRLDDLKKDGDPRPTGEAMFLEDGDALGAGAEVAAGLANAWSLAMGRGLDLDRAVKYAARAWALDSAYRARQAARSTGQNGALVRR